MEMFIKRDILYLRFEGEFDQNSVSKIKYKIVELIEKYRIKYIVFNFRKLKFMDSSGIGFIIGRYNFLKKNNGKVFICSMNDQIRRIVLLSGLSKICVIKEDEIDVNKYLGVA
jgi:stage II sporulation protein AA (anti-sigma F factor antagonist)